MKRQRVVVVLCAACCCFALVTLSSSLETTVSGSPEDEFDVGADDLPLSADDTGELKDAYQSGSGEEGASSSSDQEGERAPAVAENRDQDRETGQRDGDPSGDASSTRTATSQAADRAAAQSADASDSESSQSGEGSGLATQNQQRDWLATARDLLSGVLGLGVGGVIVALGWLAFRYRERLLGQVVGDQGAGERFGAGATADDHPFEPPANEVERVWVEMAERGDVAIDSGMTPAECADRLGAEGFDRDAVEELTELFQRVRYGSAVTTTERVERARECLQRSVPTTDGGERQ
jgi:hypothetical protein